MSVVDSMVIDGIALTEDKNGIVLLITDHWIGVRNTNI